jgi:diguanylate cyclase (GGDEF)-like protein
MTNYVPSGRITQAILRSQVEGLRKQLEETAAQVARDPLTGIINKAECDRVLLAELEKAAKGICPVSIAFLDIDNYGRFNKEFGQLTGDAVLKQLTQAVTGQLRAYDLFGRYGGEEFILILPGTTAVNAFKVVDRLRAKLEDNFEIEAGGEKHKITFSCGVASSEDTLELADLVQRANDAERAAKADGKARCYLNLCGAILSYEETEELLKNEPILDIIERYRKRSARIVGPDGRDVPMAHFLKTVKVIQPGDVQGGDLRIVGPKGDPGAAFSAFLRAPDEQTLSPVRDTVAQLLEGLRYAGLERFAGKELWISGVGKLNFLNLLVTHACNMACIYCTQDHRGAGGLPIEIWKKAIDEASEEGKRRGVILSITGGEPLAKRSLTLELLAYGAERGMFTTMNTNATLLDYQRPGHETLARDLVATGIRSLNVSLDSHLPFIEDAIVRARQTERGVVNGYRDILGGLITLMRAREQEGSKLERVTLNHVLTGGTDPRKQNFSVFADFVETMCRMREKLGPIFDDINPLPVKEAPGLYLRMDELEYFNKYIVPRLVKLARKYNLPLLERKIRSIFGADVLDPDAYANRLFSASMGIYYSTSDMRTLPCATCMVSATILPDGSVYPCTYMREAREDAEGRLCLGNIKDRTMAEMRAEYYDTLARLPRVSRGGLPVEAINRICERNCGPDLKGVNRGIMAGLRKAGAIA